MSIFIRKYWKKIILSIAAIFWTSCDTDSVSSNQENNESQEIISQDSTNEVIALYGIPTINPDTAVVTSSCSSSIFMESSSSDVAKSSSSSAEKIYRLANDNSVLCERKDTLIYGNPSLTQAERISILEENFFTLKHIQEYEKNFLYCDRPVALYGSFFYTNTPIPSKTATKFDCSNGKEYRIDFKQNAYLVDNLVYTLGEYFQKYDSTYINDFLYKHSDYRTKKEIVTEINRERYNEIKEMLSDTTRKDISEKKRICLDSLMDKENDTLKITTRNSYEYENPDECLSYIAKTATSKFASQEEYVFENEDYTDFITEIQMDFSDEINICDEIQPNNPITDEKKDNEE